MKKWTFLLDSEPPVLIVCESMPDGTVFFDTETGAIDSKLNSLSKIQRELERRKYHLEYKQQEKQYEDAGILPKTT